MPGTDVRHVVWRDDRLHCESADLAALAATHGTPLYVYSEAEICDRFQRLRDAFGPETRICFAVKSNSNLAVLRLLHRLGAGFDLVSGGELLRLRAAGVPTQRSVFAGVGKDEWEVEAALQAGILFFNLESPHEIELLERAGMTRGVRVPVAVRLNPDVDPRTHAYISTGKKENKFGLGLDTAGAAVERIVASPHLSLVGYHVHLGSQVASTQPYLEALERVQEFLAGAPERRSGLRYLDLGGGFGVRYKPGDPVLDPAELGAALVRRVRGMGLELLIEPGRFLVAEAGLLLTRVLGTKGSGSVRFLLVDAAMNDLIRPALYQASHPVVPVVRPDPDAPLGTFDVVGPVCESSDFLARGVMLPPLHRGDLLAVLVAGAYGAVMASNYNSRRRPAEVLVSGSEAKLVRRRDRFEDLWAAELDT
ncbi:MAG: diaminopimelate decarboxylase [Planctomycetes bacterium]|nr:diaminopimelate decarboxylase [Planctomycetota bacterium]